MVWMNKIVLQAVLVLSLALLSKAVLGGENSRNRQMENARESYLSTHDRPVPRPGQGRGSNRIDSNLTIMGSSFWSGVNDGDVVGNLAYCAFVNGLVILDVADPVNPTHVSTTPLAGQGLSISINGSHAYVASGLAGLHVLDISDPAVPLLVATLPMEGSARRLRIQDSLAFVATIAKLYIVNISDPAHPQILADVDAENADVDAEYGITSLDVDENLLYVADVVLKIFEISDPATPVLIGGWGLAKEVCVVDSIAYVSFSEYMAVINVSDPTSPQELTSGFVGLDIRSIVPFSYYIFVASDFGGLSIYDMSDPTTMVYAGYVPSYGANACYPFADSLLLVTTVSEGVQVADILPMSSPEIIGAYDVTPAPVLHFDVDDMMAFQVAGYAGDLFYVDVTQPENITIMADFDTPYYTWDIEVSGDLAFVSECDSGLLVYDISDPNTPVRVGGTATNGCASEIMKLDGDLLYLNVNNGMTNLAIIDVSEPLDPIVQSQMVFPIGFAGLDARGSLLYVAVNSRGLHIFDVVDPVSPVLINEYTVPGHSNCLDVAVDGNLAYVIVTYGLVVLDVSDPMNPFLVSEVLTDDRWESVALAGNTAYCGIRGGIEVLDIADPANPLSAGYLTTPGTLYQMIVQGRMIYLSDYYSFMIIADTRGIDCCDMRADLTHGGTVDVADLTYFVEYLFAGGPSPQCQAESDINFDGQTDVSDLTYLVEYLFLGGSVPTTCP